MNATYEFTAGRLLWSAIRYIVDKIRLVHPCLVCIESGGWIEHKFFLRGPVESIQAAKIELETMRTLMD